MALSLGGLTLSTSLNVGGLVSTLTSAVGGLSTASVVLTQSAASSTTSAPGLLPSPVQSLLNNLTATSSSQPAVTSSSLFAGLQVQVPGLPLDVGFPFLVENITPPRVNSSLFDQYFKSLRLAWSPELVTLQNTGTDAAPSFDTSNTPLLDAGQPFTVLTALPQPGTVVSLPIAKNSTSSTSAAPSSTSGVSSAPTPTPNGFASNTLFTIPENAFITSKWDFYKSDGAAFVPVTRKDYKLLNGSLFGTASGSSQYVFYPNPDLSSVRSIVGCLNTTIFIPDGSNKNLAAPRLCLGGRISAWSSVFSIESGVIRNYPGTKGLFHIDIDTNAPLPGNPITLLVNPVDKLPLLAPRVDTIVDAAPDLKVTAAIDFGAPLNAFIGAGVKAITGLFNSGTADKVGSGVLTVAGVLDGLLTVPLAVDFKGRSVTKTLKPAADMITQNVLPLARGLAGSLPIGSLVASIESAANNISFLLPQDVKYIQEPLQGLHGLTLNLLPDFVAAGTNDLPRRITMPVTLKPSITLPGRDQPLINEIYLGDIAITLPRVSLPQIAMLFHDPGYTSSSGDDILVPLDPALYRLASSPAQVRAVLEQLNTLMSELRNIFRGLLDVDLRNSIDNLLGTASTMLGFFARAPEKGKGYIKVVNGNQPGLGYYPLGQDEDTFKGDAGLSAMLWVGLPSAYRLNIRFDNNQNLWMRGAKGSNFSAAFYSFRANSATSGVCIQSEERDGDDCRELASMGDVEGTYQDKARRLSFKSRQ